MDASYSTLPSVDALINEELESGLFNISEFRHFQKNAEKIKNKVLMFLINAKQNKKTVIGYGAAAKGSTLLNFAGVSHDLMTCIADINEEKQGKYMPGSHIPIVSPDVLLQLQPDYVFIFPWNIKDEIIRSMRCKLPSTTEFVTAIPDLCIARAPT